MTSISEKNALRLTQVTQCSLCDALCSNHRHCEFVRKLLLHLPYNIHSFQLIILLESHSNHDAKQYAPNTFIMCQSVTHFVGCFPREIL